MADGVRVWPDGLSAAELIHDAFQFAVFAFKIRDFRQKLVRQSFRVVQFFSEPDCLQKQASLQQAVPFFRLLLSCSAYSMLTDVFGLAPFQIVGAVVQSVPVFVVDDGIAVRVAYERLGDNPMNAFHLPQVADWNLDVMVSVENYGLDYRPFAFEIPFDVSEVRHVERHAGFRLGEFYECFFIIGFHIKNVSELHRPIKKNEKSFLKRLVLNRENDK